MSLVSLSMMGICFLVIGWIRSDDRAVVDSSRLLKINSTLLFCLFSECKRGYFWGKTIMDWDSKVSKSSRSRRTGSTKSFLNPSINASYSELFSYPCLSLYSISEVLWVKRKLCKSRSARVSISLVLKLGPQILTWWSPEVLPSGSLRAEKVGWDSVGFLSTFVTF